MKTAQVLKLGLLFFLDVALLANTKAFIGLKVLTVMHISFDEWHL